MSPKAGRPKIENPKKKSLTLRLSEEEAKASPTEKQLKIALENEQNRNYETDLLNNVVTQKATTRQMADISKPIAQDEKVYDKPEVDPEFEGGSVKLFEFIAKPAPPLSQLPNNALVAEVLIDSILNLNTILILLPKS